MNRKDAQKFISELFGRDSKDLDTYLLSSISRDLESQMYEMQTRDLYRKVLDAISTEIYFRRRLVESGRESYRLLSEIKSVLYSRAE